MKKYAFLVLTLLLIYYNCFSQEKNTTTKKIETYLNNLEKTGFSGTVLVAKDGEILLSNGYGFSNREKKIKNISTTIFDIGSITKQFTAAGILKLEMQSKLSINDKLSKYFKNLPYDKQQITLHHLLTHSSGLTSSIGYDYESITTSEFVKTVVNTDLLFPVGTSYEYSNVGYSLLAIIIEKVSNKTYEEFLYKTLWKPSKMEHTGYTRPNFKSKIAVGYSNDKIWGKPNEKKWDIDAPYWHLKANGGILSSVEDMYKWHLALLSNKILSEAAIEKYFTPYVQEGEGAPSYYSYGWAIYNTSRATKLASHNGGNGIFFADFWRYLDDDTVIVLLNNNYSSYSQGIAQQIGAIIFLPTFEPRYPRKNDSQNGSQDVSPKEARLEEFLEVLKEGDLKSYIENNFTNEFIKDFGLNGHLEFLNTVRSREGSFVLIKTIESRMGYLKSLVESEKTKEQMALILEFSTSPPFKILGLGLEAIENIEDKGKEKQPANLTYAEKLLYEFFIAMRGNENELKKFIKDNFEENFLNDHGGVEGHYNFLRNNFRKGLELISVLNADTNEVVAKARSIENGNILKVSLSTIGSNHKISIIGITN